MIICYPVLEMWHMTDVIVAFNFRQLFALLPPTLLTAQKMKISNKSKKRPGDNTILHNCTKKIMIIGYTVPEIWHVTDVIVVSFCAIFCSFKIALIFIKTYF